MGTRQNLIGQEVTLSTYDAEFTEKGFLKVSLQNQTFLVLNALPYEEVTVRVYARKKRFWLAYAVEILVASAHRKAPKDQHFMATSPWEIIDDEEEQALKRHQIKQAFSKIEEQVTRGEKEIIDSVPCIQPRHEWAYRNKVEFSFFMDHDDRLRFAFNMRGSWKTKIPVDSFALLPPRMNEMAGKIIDFLRSKHLTKRECKHLVLQYSFEHDQVIAGLYVQEPMSDLPGITDLLDNHLIGIGIYYTDPRTPAAVAHETIAEHGTLVITERILNHAFQFRLGQFFQTNPEAFSLAVSHMKTELARLQLPSTSKVVDLYAGVGTLGQLLGEEAREIHGVEMMPDAKEQAEHNAGINHLIDCYQFEETDIEKMSETIEKTDLLIVDPPRPGIGKKALKQILQAKPSVILYLSCNPKTQAEDISAMIEEYELLSMEGFNFFPQTPHIENLAILRRRE